jgi:hypothetical protein
LLVDSRRRGRGASVAAGPDEEGAAGARFAAGVRRPADFAEAGFPVAAFADFFPATFGFAFADAEILLFAGAAVARAPAFFPFFAAAFGFADAAVLRFTDFFAAFLAAVLPVAAFFAFVAFFADTAVLRLTAFFAAVLRLADRPAAERDGVSPAAPAMGSSAAAELRCRDSLALPAAFFVAVFFALPAIASNTLGRGETAFCLVGPRITTVQFPAVPPVPEPAGRTRRIHRG